MNNSIYDRLVELRNRLKDDEDPVIYEEDHLLLDEVLDKIESGDWKEERFKKGDKVRWIGHTLIIKRHTYNQAEKENITIKKGTIGEVHSSWRYWDGKIGVTAKFEGTPELLDVNSKYLEKVEEE